MKYLIILLLVIGVINPKIKNANAISNNSPINGIDTSKYAIFNYDKEHWPLSFDKDSKSCSLSLAEIKQIDILINKEVIRINKEAQKKLIKNPSKFYKQLVAVSNSKGEKVVWVNCMCNVNDSPDWKKRIIVVSDGGSCYFNFKVNLTTNNIYDFIINGEG